MLLLSLRSRFARVVVAVFGGGAALVLAAMPIQADVITWDLTYEFSGATPPVGTLTVVLTDTDPDTVEFTVDAKALVGTEFVNEVLLNVAPPDLIPLTITDLGGPYSTPDIDQGVDAYKADGDGYFDIQFDFANKKADRLNAGEAASFLIVGDGLNVHSFEALSAPGGGHGPFYVAAHVQGICGDESGWVTTGNGDMVPEASTMVLFGSGVPGLLLWARSRRRKAGRRTTAGAD